MLATLIVDVNTDAAAITDDGNLRLREAIAYVNGTPPGPLDRAQIDDSIHPLGEDDTIVFAPNLDGSTININPSFGSLGIIKPVHIFGPSNRVTIRPQVTPTIDMYGLIYSLNTPSSHTIFLSDVNITGFTSGIRVDALLPDSRLVVTDSSLSGNNLVASGGTSVGGAGIEITASQRVDIAFSNISGNRRYGVYVHDNSSDELVSIQNNSSIANNGLAGVYFENANRPFNIGANDIVDNLSGFGIWIKDSGHPADSRIEAENIVSGNGAAGIGLENASYPSLIIQQNVIGTDFEFNDDGNGGAGVAAVNSELQAIQLNTIGFNGGSGISLQGTDGVGIVQNKIGTNSASISSGSDLGNSASGITLSDAADTFIWLNSIAFNNGNGITIVDDPGGIGQAARNIIFTNDFWRNAGIPIDLGNDGPTPNDQDDGDNGPNALLNHPEFLQSQLTFSGGVWQVPVRIDVDAVGEYAIQLYAYDPVQDSYLVRSDPIIFNVTGLVQDGPEGDLSIPLIDGIDAIGGERITASLIGDSGNNENNTSEFSPPIVLDVTPPRITDVRLSGSGWTGADPYSYAAIVPTGKQLAPAYFQGVDTIQIEFNEEVVLAGNGDELTLFGSNGTIIPVMYEGYNFATNVATWSTASPLWGKYRIELVSTVEDLAGNDLDGEWTNLAAADTNAMPTFDNFEDDGVTAENTFPSGTGVAGGSFEFFFSVLPGDYNQDGFVRNDGDTSDLLAVKDGNGDGDIDVEDGNLVNTNVGQMLPFRANMGDYKTDDDIVNNADYMVWRNSYGSSNPAADGNGDGIVNTADYTIWVVNKDDYSAWHPNTSPGGGSVQFVQIGAPRVINVVVSGSTSTHAPYSFDTVDGSGEQLRTVPVGGADTISITFSEDVNIQADSLTIVGLRSANRPAVAEFIYDIATMTATWRLDPQTYTNYNGYAIGDHYAISLSDAVTDIEGNPLDGEWDNPATLATTGSSQFPSGDGEAGGDFHFVFTLLPGDADRNLVVDDADTDILAANYGYLTEALFTEGDFTGDGYVDNPDEGLWFFNYGGGLESLSILADLNGDLVVDSADLDILYANDDLANPTQADGDLDGDGDIDLADVDLAFAQLGLQLEVVS